jgi:hypothetical protein
MAAIFPKASDLVMKVGGLVLGLGLLGGVGAYVYFSHPKVIDTGYQPIQPVPYSHKLHVGNWVWIVSTVIRRFTKQPTPRSPRPKPA